MLALAVMILALIAIVIAITVIAKRRYVPRYRQGRQP